MSDYLFESGRVHALEKRLVGREHIELLLATRDTVELPERLREIGVQSVTDVNGRLLREETLLGILRAAYTDLGETVRTAPPFRLWLYPYDCNNVKAAIKGYFLGIDPRSMMFDFGTVPVNVLLEMVKSKHFEGLSPKIAQAAVEAIEAYAKNRNPQRIDFLIDRACFADMLVAAQMSQSHFAIDLVRMKIDLTNVVITLRLLRMENGETGKRLLEEALIEGGSISVKELRNFFDGGEDMLWKEISRMGMAHLSERVAKTDRGLTAVERSSDDVFMDKVREAKWIPYGVEPIIAFLIATEYDVRNLRIVIAGKEAGLSADRIRERIRESYV